ncbi:MAG: hypothetical protein JWL60_1963, partial [Gemmatimonadetes bacterium]|nr:hypothetical protein [Gemmatimonadota bacterium]
DTVRTLTGPATTGLHRVTWDFRGRLPRPAPLSPAARRDSIVQARRFATIVDSLEREKALPQPLLVQLRAAVATGNTAQMQQLLGGGGGGGGGGRGAGGAGGAYNPRPGEGPAPRAGAEGAPDPARLADIARLFRAPGGGGRGAGGAPVVSAGDYLVTMVAGGERQRQVIRVERLPGGGAAGGGFGGEEEEEP